MKIGALIQAGMGFNLHPDRLPLPIHEMDRRDFEKLLEQYDPGGRAIA